MEAATVHGGLVHIKSDELGYNPASSANPYLANIAIVDGGSITVTTKDTGAQPDLKLLLTPRQDDKNGNAPIRWDCSVVIGDPDEAPLYCRHAPAAPATSSSPANAATVSTP
jgi:type IV pilus assembly protein PilA